MSKEFFEQYNRPEWQKKRLEAMQRAGFKCSMCGNDEDKLQVHHRKYISGRKVWEYDISELDVLCDSCHGYAHATKDLMDSVILGLNPDRLYDAAMLIVSLSDIDDKAVSDLAIVVRKIKGDDRVAFAKWLRFMVSKDRADLHWGKDDA